MKGLFERMKEMDIVKLRIIVISFMVLSFVFCLVLLRIGAEHLGLTGGELPLLKLMEEEKPDLLKGSDLDALNKHLGKEVIIQDRVKGVKVYPDEGYWVIRLTYVSVPLGEKRLEDIEREGILPQQLKGMEIRVEGILKVHPIYGFQLFLAKDSNIEFVEGKVGH